MPLVPFRWRLLLALLLALPACAQELPPAVLAALARAEVPLEAVSVLLQDARGHDAPRLSLNADLARNPASVLKLVTTSAALDLLGPAYTWSTPVYSDAPLRQGVLQGNLYIQGQGDPQLVLERLWLLLRRVQGLGVNTIASDIVLDHSAFTVEPQDPAAFDGAPLKPYNAAPDALLLNYKSVVMTFAPEPGGARAHVQYDPPLQGVQMPASVPLSEGACGDWRGALRADFSDPARFRFAGSYPRRCAEPVWPVAYADPASYAARAVAGLWREMGGTLRGRVRDGSVPAALLQQPPLCVLHSPALAEVVRDINKFSNNVMAEQLYLTLGAGRADAARARLQQWWQTRLGSLPAPQQENGSGLSRSARISALALARLLQLDYAAPYGAELTASLPLAGVDGTLRRLQGRANGRAHLKSGSLADVVALAGYVHRDQGPPWVLVVLINHPNANAARPALEALLDWTAQQDPP